jgi:uncharacterized protein
LKMSAEPNSNPAVAPVEGSASAPKAMIHSAWRSAWTKAPFLIFCWISLFIFIAIGGVFCYLVHPRAITISPWLDRTILAVVALISFVISVGLFLITLTALTGIDLLYPHNKQSVTVKFLFPIAATLSQILCFDRNRLRASFVKVNNALTKAQRNRIKGERILVLLPHCLQIDVCNRKLTSDINNCMRCGRCPVGALVQMGEKLGLKIEVVNGGTLARKKVASFHPDGIVAVACERDLTFGIQDVHPIPVFGVLNDRPNGPCYNTCVDMSLVEAGIKFFKKQPSL